MRHSGGGKVPMIACTHEARTGICCAEFLTAGDRALNHERFYASGNKVEQDALLLRLMHIPDAKPVRVKDKHYKQSHSLSNTYYLMTINDQGRVRVCKATFCSILGLSLDCVTRVARYYHWNHCAPRENWGGHRHPEAAEQKKNVINHIKQFKCRPSHYSRKDCPGRKYLPSDLRIAKMFRMFKEQSQQQVSYSLYHSIFLKAFNLGFGHPASDVCSTYMQFHNEVKDPAIEEQRKKELAAMFILHRRQAWQFYTSHNNIGNSITICFDMMENLVLPRTPIGQAYYSRQLYLYIFGVVMHQSDRTQTKGDIHLFTWLESENKKDSNMIASALLPFFQDFIREEMPSQQEKSLFSDSCYGQNKNLNVMAMLLALRNQKYPDLRITYTFPSCQQGVWSY